MSKPTRTRRILRRCAIGLGVVLLLVVLGTWLAHRHLSRLIVASFNRTYPELVLSTKTAALSFTGELILKDVRVRTRRDGATVFNVPSAKVRFSWAQIRSNYLREIEVENPRIHVTDALLTALPSDSAADENSAPWRIGHLSVRGGKAHVQLTGQPEARFGFQVEMNEGEGTNEIALSSLSVRTQPDGAEVFTLPSLKVHASAEDLRRQRIRGLVAQAPRIVITDQLLASFASSFSSTSAPSSSSISPAWLIEALRLEGGHVAVDLAAWPRTEFTFAATLRDKLPNGETPAELLLMAVSMRLREGDQKALNMASVRLRGTVEGIHARKLKEVRIESPNVTVTQPLLALFTGQPAKPAAAPSAPPAPEKPWELERLYLSDGKAQVELPGAPLVQFGFAAEMGDDLLPPRERGEMHVALDVTNVSVRASNAPQQAPFLRIPAVRTKFRLPEIQRERRVAWVLVEGFDFRFNKVFRDFIALGQKPSLPANAAVPAPVEAEPSRPYSLGELVVTDGAIHLDDLGLGLPSIGCRVNTSFRNLALAPDAGPAGQELQTIELSRIALTSPLDPFVSVLTLDTVFIRFTLAGIWRREIEEVAIVRPRLDIGPDLFWYVDRVQQNESAPPADAAPPAEDGPPWQIHRFSATAGQLFLALEGHSEVALPMPFESHAENLNFQKLSDLRLKLTIDMPVQDYDYPGYELTLLQVGGRVEFSLPPAQGANNVVNTLRLGEVRWKQFRGRDFFLDVTYDEKGIYGNLGGRSYGGDLRGQFNFLIGGNSAWNGWMSGSRIDLKPITDVLAPEKFSLSGPASFRLTVAAQGSSIDQVVGDFKSTKSGHLRIGKIDELIKELPGDWSGLKRGLSRISLEALRDFAYDTAHGDFRFKGLTGALHLDLRGPEGARKVEVNFHEGPQPRKGRRVAAREPQ